MPQSGRWYRERQAESGLPGWLTPDERRKQQMAEWAALSPEEQEAAGGYYLSVPGTRPAINAPSYWQPWQQQQQQPAQGAGWGEFGAATQAYGAPQYSGFQDFEALQQQLFQQQMAGVSAEFGRRGMLSSSDFQHATVGAMAQAQAQRYQIELSERARRTQWEEQQAMNRWRMYQWAASAGTQSQQFYASLQQQGQLQREQYAITAGSMDDTSFWNLQRILAAVAIPRQQQQTRTVARSAGPGTLSVWR